MSLDIGCHDTICALSSAQGPAALALVRASGPRALEIFQQIFKPKGLFKAFKAMHGLLQDQHGRPLDDCVAIFYEHGRSFTGETSFEIHCHGNMIIVDEILQALCALGARLAEPGEFSMRALLNNKIDLAQAESIADLIHAQSSAAKNVALQGVQGGLGARCLPIRENIITLLAEIEARMDFPDEELGGYDRNNLINLMNNSLEKLEQLLAQAAYGIKLHEGVRMVICGSPNAGKSTLLNRLVGHERAIVHHQAGTTRDVIEVQINLHGVPLTIIDVAGIRDLQQADAVEQIGIERAFEELTQAHVVLWLADCNLEHPFADKIIGEKLAHVHAPVIRVLNKTENYAGSPPADTFMISAKLGLGLSDLLAHLHTILVGSKAPGEELFITRARQRDELMQARANFIEAKRLLEEQWADEVVTSELRAAGLAFDRLFGSELSEDVLDAIFSQFCIGK
jgi:tRNA modification GTPase